MFYYMISDGRNSSKRGSVLVHIVERNLQVTATSSGGGGPAVDVPVNVHAAASTSDGAIAEVDLYTNGVRFAAVFASPYDAQFIPRASGFYTVKAVALDTL